jgi:hypothetical protein
MAETNFVWFAGVDWDSERHNACLVDPRGTIIGELEVLHSGSGLAELADWLIRMTGAASAVAVAVAIEVPHGPVVDTLPDRGFAVYAINPKVLDRLCDRFSVAGANDDSETPMCWLMACVLIGVYYVAFKSLIRGLSNCVRGRGSPRNYKKSGSG